jgi:hypothetical protein
MRRQWKSRIDLWENGILDNKSLSQAIPRGEAEILMAWTTIAMHFQALES